MKLTTIINILAIIASPILAVVIGQWLQNTQKRTADKMDIFKTLMVGRGFGWSIDKVRALNLIEVVFQIVKMCWSNGKAIEKNYGLTNLMGSSS